jgi:hypothetical protein
MVKTQEKHVKNAGAFLLDFLGFFLRFVSLFRQESKLQNFKKKISWSLQLKNDTQKLKT